VKDISIAEITELVIAEVPDLESRLEKMFDWHFNRDMVLIRWILGTAASFAIALLIIFFKVSQPQSAAQVSPTFDYTILIYLLFIPFGIGSYGFVKINQLRSLHRQFVASLKIASELKTIRNFLVRYRETEK
jgi:hypothetical protein